MPDQSVPRQITLSAILTDIHFWVPVAVLIGGLILLTCLH